MVRRNTKVQSDQVTIPKYEVTRVYESDQRVRSVWHPWQRIRRLTTYAGVVLNSVVFMKRRYGTTALEGYTHWKINPAKDWSDVREDHVTDLLLAKIPWQEGAFRRKPTKYQVPIHVHENNGTSHFQPTHFYDTITTDVREQNDERSLYWSHNLCNDASGFA